MRQGQLIAVFMHDGNSEWSSDESGAGEPKEESENILDIKTFYSQDIFIYLSGIMTLQTKMNLTSSSSEQKQNINTSVT